MMLFFLVPHLKSILVKPIHNIKIIIPYFSLTEKIMEELFIRTGISENDSGKATTY